MLDLIALQGLLAHNRGEWFEQLRHELRRTHDSPYLANAVFDGHLCVAEYLLYGPVPYSEVLGARRFVARDRNTRRAPCGRSRSRPRWRAKQPCSPAI